MSDLIGPHGRPPRTKGMGGEISSAASKAWAMMGDQKVPDTEPTPIGCKYFKEDLNEHIVIECQMYARFCELNREHGNHGFLMGGAQAGPLQKIFSEAITEFTEKGTDGKITRSQRGDITADVADILLQTHATVQWSVVKKKLWKVAEEHYGYHLRISDLARTAIDSGVGLENAFATLPASFATTWHTRKTSTCTHIGHA